MIRNLAKVNNQKIDDFKNEKNCIFEILKPIRPKKVRIKPFI